MEVTNEHRLTVVEDRSLRNDGRIKKAVLAAMVAFMLGRVGL